MPRSPRSARPTLARLEDRTTPTAGTMDASFGGGDGIVKFNLPGHFNMHAHGVTVQPDGKTVLAGQANTTDRPDGAVYRLTADGTLDPTFGGGDGMVTLGIDDLVTTFYDVELQPDGKIVASGTTGWGTNFMVLVARFHPDGSPDLSFSGDGYLTTDLTPRDENGFSLALQADGKVVVCGNILSDSDDGFLFLRYTPDGALDTTFSLDGVLKYNPGPGGGIGRSVSVQPDGKIVGAGEGTPSGQPRGLMLVRLNDDGTFDTTFDGDGVVHTLIPGTGYAEGYDAAVLPDGRLVAVGVGEVSSMGQAVAARYLADGSLDTTFDGDGTFLLNFPPDAAGGGLMTVTADPDGRIIAAGNSAFPHNALLVRFNEDGTPDPTFGVGNFLLRPGVVTTNTGGGTEIYDLAVMPDGRMVTAGRSDEKLVAIRYLGEAVAVADEYTVTEDTLKQVGAPGVLANDLLPTGGNPQAVLDQGPAHAASFTLNADGSFAYLPAANYHGPDAFTYHVVDGPILTNTVTVSLTVESVNDVPTSAAEAYEYRFFSPLTVSAADGVLKNDADADGDTLHAVLVDPPAQGTVDLNDDGSFTFTYPNGLTGSFTFTYKATDGTADGPVTTVTLTRAPNAPPVSGNDAYPVLVFGPLEVPAVDGVLKNDADADGEAIAAELVSPPAVGTLDLRADGSFTYSFPPDFVGSVTFTYTATDGIDVGAPATVTLTRAGLVHVADSKLTVIGTAGVDVVRLRPAGKALVVETQTPLGLAREVVRPAAGLARFTRIEVYLGDGDDRLDTTALKVPVRAVGGAGNDVLRTGAGADTLFGDDPAGSGTGVDVIESGAGNDAIAAGNGRNQINAGAGKDTVTAGTGGSFIDAGGGNDSVTVAGGANWIEGGSGTDVLVGGTGNDRIVGGAGKDLLIGGLGADLVDGGAGMDLVFDGTVTLVDPATNTWSGILARYRSANPAVLADIRSRLNVTPDTVSADTLTGGSGLDWLWSADGLDVLDLTGAEPKN